MAAWRPRPSIDVWADVVGQPHAVAQLTAAAAHPVHSYLLVGPSGSGQAGRRHGLRGAAPLGGQRGGGRRAPPAPRAGRDAPRPPHRRGHHRAGPHRRADRQGDREAGGALAGRGRPQGARARGLPPHRPVRRHPPQVRRGTAAVDVLRDPRRGRPAGAGHHRHPLGAHRPRARAAGRRDRAAHRRGRRRRPAPRRSPPRPAATSTGPGCSPPTSASPCGPRRCARCPAASNGTGARAAELAAEIKALIDDAQDAIDARHEQEAAELEERIERYGQRGSGKKDIVDRHKREVRRHRFAELRLALADLRRRLPRRARHRPPPRRGRRRPSTASIESP